MKKTIYILPLIFLCINGILIFFAPDRLSKIFVVAMLILDILGIVMHVIPVISFTLGLNRGVEQLHAIRIDTSNNQYDTIMKNQNLFSHKRLNKMFDAYREKVDIQERSGQILCDIEETINEDTLLTLTWNNVATQIPGTLTGLGILGTFLGLLLGIRQIGFSSIEAALTSVESLVEGIYIAFYTSIAGVLLSILFNILQKVSRNLLERNISGFISEFHIRVIPTRKEQEKFQEKKAFLQIMEQLERIPKTPSYSVASSTHQTRYAQNDTLLMPQIIEGLKNKEFTFFAQPKYDINTKRIISAEALVRWQHPRLGIVTPNIFLPVIEENGYIRKLDEYIWEQVIASIEQQTNQKDITIPLAINVSKTDILSGDVAKFLKEKTNEHHVPPRMIDVEIAINAFLDVPDVAEETASTLRSLGFRVILDGFNGDIMQLASINNQNIDAVKLDLRLFKETTGHYALSDVVTQARSEVQEILVEGIETMNEVTTLRKCGCTEGQGYYFSKPIAQDMLLEMLNNQNAEDN